MRARRQVAAGNALRAASRWSEAAERYAAALAIRPDWAAIHVQHGHMLKESGDRAAAERASLRALAIAPDAADTWLQLGHLLKIGGRLPEAIEGYRTALVLDPQLAPAARELTTLGAADRVPAAASRLRDADLASASAAMAALTAKLDEALGWLRAPGRSFASFRQSFPVAPPPTHAAAEATLMEVVVDARRASAAQLDITLTALQDQAHLRWHATCLVDAPLAGHPVASLAEVDARISLAAAPPADGVRLFLAAGTVLDPQALAWFAFVYRRTGCRAAYCDHDRADEAWRGRRLHHSPSLQPRFDPHWFDDGLSPPAAILLAGDAPTPHGGEALGRALCATARAGGGVTHVPRLLATIVDVEAPIRDAPDAAARPQPGPARQAPAAARDGGDARISVIIPTRDQAGLLASCVASLCDRATRRDRIEFVIVDNRSELAETHRLLDELARRRGATIMTADEPFNWSRINNLAAHRATGELLLFVNNDTEMLTDGWDALVARDLADAATGLVGARLLYPDRTVQHAGVVFGMGEGDPRHEGVGAAEDTPGPDGRWLRRRAAAAVTGACMAMRRTAWRQVGGFDERLPLNYNDVDMCLRVRDRRMRVLYAADLLLVHHESKTRGFNVDRDRVAWERAELRLLHERWGDRLFEDPTLNPHWNRDGPEFSGYREPPLSEILAAIDRNDDAA